MIVRSSALRAAAFPLAVLLISLSSLTLAWRQAKAVADRQVDERFESEVDRLQDSITERLETYITILRAGAGLFASDGAVTPDEFRRFVDQLNLQRRYPGIQGIGYSVAVPASNLAQLVQDRQRAGDSSFHVWPADPRPEYHAIVYLAPLDRRNAAAIGYDMFTDPTRRAAMERARDTGQAAVSSLVTLVQEIDADKQPGFLIYMPVYEGGATPATVEERRARLRGFVYSPFRTGDLFAGILGRNPRPRAGFALYDGDPSEGRLLHRTAISGPTGRLTSERITEIGGRRWTAVMFSAPALDDTSSSGLLGYMLWAGIGVSVALTALAAFQSMARQRAERSKAEATEASRQFQQLANWIPQLAWMAAPDGGIYWYNDRWYDYTGMDPKEMAGWGWQSVLDPAVLSEVLERWRASLRTGGIFEMEFPLRGADGQFRTFLTRAAPFRDDTGRIVHWFGTNTDVQYRHDADLALLEQAETLEIVNRSGAQLAAELDLDRLVQTLTDAGTRLTRARFGAFFHNEINERGEAYALYALSGTSRESFATYPKPRNTAVFGPTFRGEAIIRSADITADPRYGMNAPYHGLPPGHPPVRSYLAVPVKSRSGEVLGGLFFGHENVGVFTERAEHLIGALAAQAAIAIDNARLYGQVSRLLDSERTARAEAERVSRMKDEFLATLSHELRTPLNAIVGWAHMLSNGALGETKRATAVEVILRNARIQLQLIEDLLDMSRIISGRVRIDPGIVSLEDVVHSALDVVRPTAEAKRIGLSMDAADPPHVVIGDASRLQQVVWNLLTNAIKFTPPDGAVHVALQRSGSHIELAVHDDGVGIEREFLPFVFDRFRQADGSFTRGHGGLGLGLSIVRSLVEMHAGVVRAESEGRGRGAVFTVSLPAATGGSRSDGHSAKSSRAGMRSDALRDVPVLLVDDDLDALMLGQEVLAQHGARTAIARSGDEALAVLAGGTAPIRLLVSDIGMPQMDGFELIRRVRSMLSPSDAHISAIALTAYAGSDDRRRALSAGFDLHLPKPFTPDELVQACVLLVERGSPA
jgi:PAS domain S-box-containing protein